MIRLRILGVLSLSAAACITMILLHGKGSAATGMGLALALAAPSYLALSACLHRSDKVFFSVFLGGMGFRFTAGGTAIYVVYRVGLWPVAPFAVALAALVALAVTRPNSRVKRPTILSASRERRDQSVTARTL